MSRVVHLLRHASHAHVGKRLTGRAAGAGLTEAGQVEAFALAASLQRERLEMVFTSPRERAAETAAIVADRANASCEIDGDLDEIDFGDWSGRTFDDLDGDSAWQSWNSHRQNQRPPGGETMAEAQARIVRAIERVHLACCAFVSHSDVIKAALMHYLGMPLDGWWRFEIAPASVSSVVLHSGMPCVTRINGLPS